jgi:hypothetical protein
MNALLEHYYSSSAASSDAERSHRRHSRSGGAAADDTSATASVDEVWTRPPPRRQAPAMMTADEKRAYVQQLEQLEALEDAPRSAARVNTSLHDPRARGSGVETEPLRLLDENADSAALHSRTARWKDRVTSATAELRRDLTALKQRECTFRPNINRRASAQPGSAGMLDVTVSEDSDASPQRPSGHSVYSRLYDTSQVIRQRRTEAAAEKAAKETEGCTFRPRLVRSGWTAVVQPRYLDPHQQAADVSRGSDEPVRGHRDSRTATAEDTECTFYPVTNATKTPYIAEYLNQPVYERLHRSPAATRRPQDAISTPRASHHAMTSDRLKEFTQRQADDLAKRQQAALSRQRAAEIAQPTFQPMTNKLPKGLSEEQRARQVRERQQKQEAERERLLREAYPEPKKRFCSPASRAILNKNANLQRPLLQRQREDLAKHEAQMAAAKAELEARMAQEARRDPELQRLIAKSPLDKTKPVVSELAAAQRGGLEEYMGYLHRTEGKRRQRISQTAEQLKLEREAAEAAELTFRPQIADAPEYVKQIARARSLSRQDVTALQHYECGGYHRAGSTSGRGPTTTGAMVLDPTPLRRY